MKHIGKVLTLIALGLLGIGARPAAAQESVLYSFAGSPTDGDEPHGSLISDAQGNLYGTTQYGGALGQGAVFELTPVEGGGWTETILWSFDQTTSGQTPLSSLVLDTDGNLYGTTYQSGPNNGTGLVFELSPGAGGIWTEKNLYVFGTGSTNQEGYPQGNLIFDSEGNLYGTTTYGGTYDEGTVFELSPGTGGAWTYKVLHNFGAASDGFNPAGGLVFDAEGNLYGTTETGGVNGTGNVGGIVFELSPEVGGSWTEKVLWPFGAPGDGSGLDAGLIFDAKGNIYGTTEQGGTNGTNDGTVFELSPGTGGAWTEKLLWSFAGGPSDGANPYDTLTIDAQGNLYGTTASGGSNGFAINNGYYLGTVFELSSSAGGAWTETILHNFYATSTDGFNSYAGLFADAAGNLYGTTSLGGSYYYDLNRYHNWGTVFEIGAASLPTFSPAPGSYIGAQKIAISSTTTNAVIYYTTDGTTPTTKSTKYTNPIEVSASETIMAVATLAGYPNSAVAKAAYTILPPPVAPTVSVTPSANGITSGQALTVTVAVTGPSGDPTPTGSVILSSGTYTSAAVKLSNGNATILIPAAALGAGAGSVNFETDTLTVSYVPDSSGSVYYLDATGTGSVTVTKLFPTVALTLSASSITAEQALTVTVTVNGGTGNPTPTGSVALYCCSESAVKPRSGRAAIAADSAALPSSSYTSATVTLVGGSATITIPAGSLPVGSDPLSVYYAPDSASSQTYADWAGYSSVTVTKVTPTVGLTLSAKSVTSKQPLTVTVAVNGGSGTPAPTGSVTLTGGGYTSAATTLSNGGATIAIAVGSLDFGSDTLPATYTPDSTSSPTYNSATGTGSVTVTQTINPIIALTADSSITTRQSLAVTVVLKGGSGNPTPTGSATLTYGSYTSAAATLSGGSATITVPAGTLAVGTDKFTVTYTPDSASSPIYNSVTGPSSVTVTTPITPTVALTLSASSITAKQALTVTVAVNGGSGSPAPTGSVSLTSGSYISAAATLSSGSATISIPSGSLPAGSDTLTVSYTPDSASSPTYNSATGTGSVTVTTAPKITPTVGVTLSASSITTEQALTVTVAVSGGSGNPTPTGSVTLTSGSYTSAAATLSSGSATISIPAGSLAAGGDTLTVSYTPDAASSPSYNSTTGSGSVTVTKVTPSLALTLSASRITTKQALAVTVAVSGGSGNPAPTGSVTLTSGSYTSAAATLSSGSATITVPAGSLAVGSDTLTVSYTPGSASSPSYNSATGTGSVTVASPLTPTLTVTPSASAIMAAQSLTVTVAVSGGSSNPTPSGTVQLSGGGYTSASQTLSSGSSTFTIPANSLNIGSDTLTVSYSGDSNYSTGSGSASVTVTPTPLTPTVKVTPAEATLDSGSTLNVTAAVTGSGVAPTGSVTLSGGGYTSATQTLSSGSYTFAIPANSLSAGTDTLTVTYSGDSNYAAGSGTASVTVTQSVFTLAASSPAAVSPGSPATSTVTVSTSTGYAGSVSLTCALTSSPTGATDLPTCSSGSAVTLGGATTTGTATVTVSSTAATNALARPAAGGMGRGWAAAGSAALAFVLFLGIPARRRNWRSMLGVLVLIAALGSLTACGGHSRKSSGNAGTTAGTYTFTVTATGSPSVSPTPTTTFTVTVN